MKSDLQIGLDNRKLLHVIADASNLEQKEKKYLRKLIKRDSPLTPTRYNGEVDGEQKRFIRCAECGRNLRPISEKRPYEENRFCPACGQRIDWPPTVSYHVMKMQQNDV